MGLDKVVGGFNDVIASQQAEIVRLRAENAELREDSERLAFIIKKCIEVVQRDDGKFFCWNRFSNRHNPIKPTFREAIDAAMKEQS